ncbi:hypothetical protein FOL47_008976 [Perkinsus chesapeaki]|uniref:Uncharacterized protein n=1 Tax=Perkinsus chesapeaki TaxID=330153 RepID=A0A7J6N373_PERCH|nr:hypothetical protein FOL47_008976 [Perkinsus chesapeaki]
MKLRSCVITPPTSGSDTSHYTPQIIPRSGAARLDWLRHALRQSPDSQRRDFVFAQVTEPGFWEPIEAPQLGINAISNHIDVFTEEQQKILQDRSEYPLRLATAQGREASVTRSEDSHPSRRRKVHRIGSLVDSGGYITVGSSRRVGTGTKEERSKGRALKRKVREQRRKTQHEDAKAARIAELGTDAGASSPKVSTQTQAANEVDASTSNKSGEVPRAGEISAGRGSLNGFHSVEVDYSVDSPVIACPALEEHTDPPSSATSSLAVPEDHAEVLRVPPSSRRTEGRVEDASEKKRAVLTKKQELLQKQIDLQRLILRRRRESSPPAPAVHTRQPQAISKRKPSKGSLNTVVRKSSGISPEEALRRVREMKNNRDYCAEKAPEDMSELDKFEKCKAEVMAKKQKAEEESIEAAKDGGSPTGSSDVVDEEPWFVKVQALAPSSPTAAETAPPPVDRSTEEREKALIGIVLEERYKGSSGNSDIFGDAEESDKEDPLPNHSSPSVPCRSADDELDFDENEFLRLDYSDS